VHIDFKSPSENDPFVPAGALLAGWIIKNVLRLLSIASPLVVHIGTFILIAFNLFALIIVLSYLRANKGNEFFRAIIALVVVGIGTSLIDWALFGG